MVRFILFDIERISLDDFISALCKIAPDCREYDGTAGKVSAKLSAKLKDLGIKFDHVKIEKACKILNCLKRLGFELFVNPIPMPKEDLALKVLEGSEIEVTPSKKSNISAEVITLLTEFCKTLRYPFKIVEVYNFKGFRIILGESFDFDRIAVLETNIDDITGEILANALEKLSKICLDVSAIQCIGKKGRPAVIIKALCKLDDVEKVAKAMMEETGSLGIRIIPVDRMIEQRRIEIRDVEVFGKKFKLRVKYSSSSVLKPEFEDVKKIAEELNVPLLVVYKEILRKL